MAKFNKIQVFCTILLCGIAIPAAAQRPQPEVFSGARGPMPEIVNVQTQFDRQIAVPPTCGRAHQTGRSGTNCTHERLSSRMTMFLWLGGDPAEAARLTEEDGRELDALNRPGAAIHDRRNSMFLTITPARPQELLEAGARGGSCQVSVSRQAAMKTAARPHHRWLRTVIHGDPIDACHWAYRSSHR